MILGPRSRAGLIAYPVVPPSAKPITHTKKATGTAPNAPNPTGVALSSSRAAPVEERITIINTKVPTSSEIIFVGRLRMAGTVPNGANFNAGSGVASKCSSYTTQAIKDPTAAPKTCATTYIGTNAQSKDPATAKPTLTAGLRCAPLYGPAT